MTSLFGRESPECNKCKPQYGDGCEGYPSRKYSLGGTRTDGSVHGLFPVNLEVIYNPRRILHPVSLISDIQKVPPTSKLFGSCNRSAHVPGHPEVAYEFPAQSPQNVISTVKPG